MNNKKLKKFILIVFCLSLTYFGLVNPSVEGSSFKGDYLLPCLAAKSAIKQQKKFPQADVKYKNTLAWSYQHSVDAYNYLNELSDNSINLIAKKGIVNNYSKNNTTLKALFKYAISNGFGLQLSVAGFENTSNLKKNFWCNDSFPDRKSACKIEGIPTVWDTPNSGNKGEKTVKYWSELGNIPTAFYGGWSCDYAGTTRGAAWAGVGKGHK
ncbi:hypothetical protein H9L19_07005 [Weissella diestrammenae]|uniref:Uncharacterized protein n=1 Tax=Weissella diestrammenae TaxID=1162633 RepID=A0A7G9T4U0_9LACO|nr:hypothetical protein [Weissella diestrammenae]MCM0582827.1 hypothetical protein [Weissella diestrammenae]QNN75115.1 hypothetical protein H9L19_07005 [Weissella diestrammenae]